MELVSGIEKELLTMIAMVVFVALFVSLVPDASVGKKPDSLPPGPRGPVGSDVLLTPPEKRQLFPQVRVEGRTAKAIQAVCNRVPEEGREGRLVVFLPAGKYEFEKPVDVPAGVTILGEGSKTHCFTRNLKGTLFRVKAPDVRITRLRLEGPSASRDIKGRNTGVSVSAENVRIDHCEILTFCSGVAFSGGGGQLDHCHVHHCITDGLGYGVSISYGARVLICDNDFGPCRHCLASNGALDWSSPERVGKYIHKPGVRKGHWEFVHNRVYGDSGTDYHRHWTVDTHPGMDGTFVVENNLFENVNHGLGIRDGSGIIRGNLFRHLNGRAIYISWGMHNGIPVEGTMPRDIEIADNHFEEVQERYRIGKAEKITIDGKLLPETRKE